MELSGNSWKSRLFGDHGDGYRYNSEHRTNEGFTMTESFHLLLYQRE